MLISDSMSTLWLIYGALSLVVLLAGYLGLAFFTAPATPGADLGGGRRDVDAVDV